MDVILTPDTLRTARIAAGLTVAELAAQCGIHQTTITRIERGAVDPRVMSTWQPIVAALAKASDGKKRRVRRPSNSQVAA